MIKAIFYDNICPGEYHLIFSHIGCEEEKIHIDLTLDTTITILLSHTPTFFGAVLIKGKKMNSLTNPIFQFIDDKLSNLGYRDDWNRQRYFLDDIGLSITFGVNYKF